MTLAERVRSALASSTGSPVVVELTCHCAEDEPLVVSHGEVQVLGRSDDAGKVRLSLPSIRVTGGSLCLNNLELCATEENRVQAGQLRCTDCFITSRNGCGVLCLQRAKVFLTNCEVAHCVRSGVGVNGKNTEIHLIQCAIERNNFSGIGVNHQARSIVLRDNRITANGYHGIWLNTGVVAQWLGGDLSGNRLSDKDGPGTLAGYNSETTPAPSPK